MQWLFGSATGWDRLTILILVIFMRYLILALAAWTIWYGIGKARLAHKKIQQRFPGYKDYLREIGLSVSTTFIFACIGYVFFFGPIAPYTKVYMQIGEYGGWYLAGTVILTLVIHDTYFYWMHRLIHHPVLFRFVHRAHHRSTNPTPWAAMAFHPAEAVLEFGILAIVPFLYPIHPLAIGIFLLIMMMYNVYGHLGYEIYPSGFARSGIGKWINTSVNHNMHHEFVTGNYGLYFLWWDRWMGTLRTDYDERFRKATTQ